MNNFIEYIPLEDVFEAYYDCRKKKKKTFNAVKFESDYEVELVKLWREINTQTYKIGKSIVLLLLDLSNVKYLQLIFVTE